MYQFIHLSIYPFTRSQEAVLKEGYLVKAPDVSKYVHNFKVGVLLYNIHTCLLYFDSATTLIIQKWQRKWFQLNTSGDLYFYDNEKVCACLHIACSLCTLYNIEANVLIYVR